MPELRRSDFQTDLQKSTARNAIPRVWQHSWTLSANLCKLIEDTVETTCGTRPETHEVGILKTPFLVSSTPPSPPSASTPSTPADWDTWTPGTQGGVPVSHASRPPRLLTVAIGLVSKGTAGISPTLASNLTLRSGHTRNIPKFLPSMKHTQLPKPPNQKRDWRKSTPSRSR